MRVMSAIEQTNRGNVAILRMTHGRANAIDLELCEALIQELDSCRQSSAEAVVLTGQSRVFSAGIDLPRVVEGGAPYVRVFLPTLRQAFEALFAFPKPLVSAINGHAVGGGCVLACCGDYRLVARGSGRIGIPRPVGVPFPVAPLEIMRFTTPPQHLQSMAYRGVTLTPDEALRHGLVDAIADADHLLDEAVAEADALAAVPTAAFGLMKRQLREPTLRCIRESASVDAAVLEAWTGEPTLTAIREYVTRTLKR